MIGASIGAENALLLGPEAVDYTEPCSECWREGAGATRDTADSLRLRKLLMLFVGCNV